MGPSPPDGASRVVGGCCLQLEVEVASMLVRATPLMGAFFLHISFMPNIHILSFLSGSHILNYFRYAVSSPSWGSGPDEKSSMFLGFVGFVFFMVLLLGKHKIENQRKG